MFDTTKNDPTYTFVIDTDSYSGNFVREMFAFIFGLPDCPGEGTRDLSYYQKAAEVAADFDKMPEDLEVEFLDVRVRDPGDDGIHRSYVDIATTPGYFNDGHGKHLEDTVSNRNRYKKRWPAYQSVAVFLRRRPTADEVVILKKRAQAFSALPPKYDWETRPKILGFRLLAAVTTWNEEVL